MVNTKTRKLDWYGLKVSDVEKNTADAIMGEPRGDILLALVSKFDGMKVDDVRHVAVPSSAQAKVLLAKMHKVADHLGWGKTGPRRRAYQRHVRPNGSGVDVFIKRVAPTYFGE